MRTVLVCVRTPLAAQNVAAVAARLGLAGAVRTAVSDPEAMLRLAERSADVVLADTALTRPDTVGFTRRVLARSPGAAILLIGVEDPGVATAAIAAGARGLIQGGDRDLASAIAKAILLLVAPRPATRGAPARRAGLTPPAVARPGHGAGTTDGAEPIQPGAPDGAGPTQAQAADSPEGAEQPTVVPVQRGDDVAAGEPPAEARGSRPHAAVVSPAPVKPGSIYSGTSDPRANAITDARLRAPRRGDPANPGYGRAVPGAGGGPVRRVTLTEREMQVLVGMADGKSNAEIGRELFVSEDTVKTHARRLFRKLGARDRAHAVAAGFRAGLVA